MSNDFFSTTDGYRIQKTIRSAIKFKGVGLHSGIESELVLSPAPPNHGIVFEKREKRKAFRVPAHHTSVISTQMATSLGVPGKEESRIATVEHLLSAIYAMGITNLFIEITGPEIPILDGSSLPYLDAIHEAGLNLQPFTNPTLRILKPIKIYRGGTICELLPRNRLRLTTSIDFPHPSIGLQTFALELTPKAFQLEVARARTFGFTKELERLKSQRLALGASLDNVLAFSDTAILNTEGARFPDECVRHKLLDAIGDLALCGCWIEGELVSFRGGHSIHIELLRSLENYPSHWELLPAEPIGAAAVRAAGSSQPHDLPAFPYIPLGLEPQ